MGTSIDGERIRGGFTGAVAVNEHVVVHLRTRALSRRVRKFVVYVVDEFTRIRRARNDAFVCIHILF